MNRDVIISVISSQRSEGSDTEYLEMVTEGKYYKKGKTYYITYTESETTGLAGTTTTVKVADQSLTLIRFGAVNSQFIFQLGKKHLSHYDTVHGSFTIGIITDTINLDLNDDSAKISIGYRIEINEGSPTYNHIMMHVRKPGKTEENRELYDEGVHGDDL